MSDKDVQKVNTLTECPRMTEDEIANLVRDLVAGAIFTGAQCPPDMLPSIFMVLGMGAIEVDMESVGMVYEYMHKANTMAVNGYPTFFSCQLVHKDDWAVVVERTIAASEAINRAAEGKP